MRIENEKLKIENLSIYQLKASGQIIGLVQKRAYDLTATDIETLELLTNGSTIKDIVLHFLNQKKLISFLALRRLLAFLIEEQLLINQRLIHYFRPHVSEDKKSTIESLLENILGKTEEINVNTELREVPFFRSLKPEVFSLFMKNVRVVNTPPGVFICQEGQRQRSLFVVLDGQASVLKTVPGKGKQKVATLVKGSLFGEIGFFLDSARTADVVTTEKSVIARVKYNPTDFDKLIQTERAEGLKQRFWVVHALLKSPLFSQLPEDCFDAIIFSGQMYNIPSGKVVIREGEKGQSFFIVVQGNVEVSQSGKQIRTLSQGDCFGEISLLYTLGTRTATVQSKTDAILLEISADLFYRLLAENLFLACEFEHLAISRIQEDSKRHAKS